MKKTNLELIQEKAEMGRNIPTALLQYNFDELPEHEEVKEDSFFGVRAKFNPSMPKDTVNLTYTM